MIRLALLLFLASPTLAQPADTLELATLREATSAQDPRALQPDLFARATALRLENLRALRLPQLAVTGQATLQSDVPSIPIMAPDGTSPAPPHEQARAQIEADWALFDGGRLARQADVERARLAEQTAGVAVSLYALREATTEAFFSALWMQSQAEALELAVRDLEARLVLVRTQAREGTALTSDAAAIEAEIIRLRQRVAEAEAQRIASLAVLRDLTGIDIDADDVLVLPDLEAEIAFNRQRGAVLDAEDRIDAIELTNRPEFARFAHVQDRARAEARRARTTTQPSIHLFGQAGVGRPSPFDFLSDDVSEYALVGVRLRWTPFDWGQSKRTADAARIQADISRTEAHAFSRALQRQLESHLADLDRLDATYEQDARVTLLREEILRVTTRQLDEGVTLAPAYVDALTDVTDARLTTARHQIERVRAQTRLLSALGLFPEAPIPTE
ncbi:MAG: TolC family protein [Bacteroidota bacterium]